MSDSTRASQIDRLIQGSKDVIAAARRPPGLDPEVGVSSAVTVTEGPGGQPDVRLDTAWERVVPAAELGTAVTGAITSFLRAKQPQAAPAEELPDWHPDTSGRNLNAAMERIGAALDASFAKLAEAQGQLAGERMSVVAERGRVRAQAQDGTVTAVEVDPAWATGKSGATIGMEISGVIADASTTRTTSTDPLATDPTAVYEFLRGDDVSQPSKENIEVSLTALRQEASFWGDISGKLAPIAPFVTGTQDRNALEMGIFAPAYAAYHETCTVVGRVAQTGADETRRIGAMLSTIAEVYAHEEEVNADHARSIHDELGKW